MREETAASIRRQVPNLLTLFRFVLTALFLMASFSPGTELKVWATICFILGVFTDYLDGRMARKWQVVSPMGSFLDPLADKALVLSGFLVFLARPDIEWGNMSILVTISFVVIIIREVAITVLRWWKVSGHDPLVTSIWGKLKTGVQMTTLIFGLVLLNIRDLTAHQLVWVIPIIGIGIILSATLAAISGWMYSRAAFRSRG